MDPFSSFDLFRRRVDQMFADFDQQMFGADPFATPFYPTLTGPAQRLQPTIGHEKSSSLSSSANPKEEERVVPQRTAGGGRGGGALTTRQEPGVGGAVGPWGGNVGWPSTSLMPQMRMDIIEDKDKYLVQADVPGFSKDQIHLNIKEGQLELSGETAAKKEETDPDRTYHRVERSSGSIYRSIRLPPNVKEDQISATCENGVLKVVLPKEQIKETKKERNIRVA